MQRKQLLRYTLPVYGQYADSYCFGCGTQDVNRNPLPIFSDLKVDSGFFNLLLQQYCKVGINNVFFKLFNFEYRIRMLSHNFLNKLINKDTNAHVVKTLFEIVMVKDMFMYEIIEKTALRYKKLVDALMTFGAEFIPAAPIHSSGISLLYRVDDVCKEVIDSRPSFLNCKRTKLRFCKSLKFFRPSKIKNYLNTAEYDKEQTLDKTIFKMTPKAGFCSLSYSLMPEHSNLMPEEKDNNHFMVVDFAYDLSRFIRFTFAGLKNKQFY